MIFVPLHYNLCSSLLQSLFFLTVLSCAAESVPGMQGKWELGTYQSSTSLSTFAWPEHVVPPIPGCLVKPGTHLSFALNVPLIEGRNLLS